MFNIFETFEFAQFVDVDKPPTNKCAYEEVLFIYMRILQKLSIQPYNLNSNDKAVFPIGALIKDMMCEVDGKRVFEQEVVERALKILIYSGIIIETKIGGRLYIFESRDKYAWENVKIKDENGYGDIKVEINNAATLYYKHMLSQFQYIHFMSHYYVSDECSPLRDPKHNAQKLDYIQFVKDKYFTAGSIKRYEKNVGSELSVTLFLLALFYVLAWNIDKQKKDGTREIFKKNFCECADATGEEKRVLFHPWTHMVEEVIDALEGKKEFTKDILKTLEKESERKSYENRQKCLNELASILKQALEDSKQIFDH
jgi:hypothetical protein